MASRSSWMTYKKLLRFVAPYKKMLVLGIFAGLFTGASSFGVLKIVPEFLNSFSKDDQTQVQGDGVAEQGDEESSSWISQETLEKLGLTKERLDKIAKFLGIDGDGQQQINMRFLIFVMAAMILFLSVRASSMVINRFCMRWVGTHVVRDIRNLLFEHMQAQSLRFYGKSDVGELISRVNNDTGAIERAVSTTIADLTRAPITILAVLIYVVNFTIQKQIHSLWMFAAIVALVLIAPIFHLSRRIKTHLKSSLERISDLNSRMHEVFTGIRVVKAFNMGDEEVDRFKYINKGYVRKILKALKAELAIEVVLEVMNVVLALAIAVYCYRQNMTLGELMSLVVAGAFLYQPCKRLAKVNTALQRSAAAAERIFDMLTVDLKLDVDPNAESIDSFDDKIEFSNVDFSYDKATHVLKGVSFDIPKGSVVAFVGQAGCGKSTAANMVGRFYDPDSGKVLIDGRDLKRLDMMQLRSLIGVVTQDTILFNDTIANNIAYGSDSIDMEKVVEAAKRARAHGFISERDEGYDTVVGDKGFALSGGQKQRVAIARALYRDPQILILDEATSALDSVTEREVQETLDELMEGRTVLAIAHRLSTIRHADKIIVFEQGDIIESGTHEELMALGGKYSMMTEIQDS